MFHNNRKDKYDSFNQKNTYHCGSIISYQYLYRYHDDIL